jgi:hypothetical protein
MEPLTLILISYEAGSSGKSACLADVRSQVQTPGLPKKELILTSYFTNDKITSHKKLRILIKIQTKSLAE